MTRRLPGVAAVPLTALICAISLVVSLVVSLSVSFGVSERVSLAAPASVGVPGPSPWPDTALAQPQISTTAHTLRLFGADRFQTGLAIAVSLRGQGGYPFATSDRSSGGATSLGAASNWWGARSCPRAIIIVAGDSPSDALVAAALSDPTGNSTEPFLQRTAAADPLFDPIGGFARIDTDSAPVLITRSARSGGSSLTPATRIAAQDLRSGGCTTARQAIIVGGPAAVPTAVDTELVSIGYSEVFRVSGTDRYATAAQIATSLGTAGRPAGVTTCADPLANDGAVRTQFYANSVIEYRPAPDQCQLLGRTVVLTDGITGADALAAGWWTGFWQVPMLLHNGSEALPLATVEALTTMNVDNVVLLGGPARISTTVAAQAAAIAEATVIRVGGADRYATSVEMAKLFGGWWPTATGAEFRSSMLCLAASSGSGANAVGWPDAMTSGPFCGALHGEAGDPRPPVRALGPVTGSPAQLTSTSASMGHDAVPTVLVPYGATSLPASVATFLADAFPTSASWCASGVEDPCLQPGFAVVFGGPQAVTEPVVTEITRLVSGRSDTDPLTTAPTLTTAFGTELDLSPLFGLSGTGAARVCVPRDAYGDARWVSVFTSAVATRLVAAADVMSTGRYLTDADATVRSPGVGAPVCIAHDPALTTSTTTVRHVRSVSPTGRVSPVISVPSTLNRRLTMSGDLNAVSTSAASGVDSDLDTSGGGVTNRQWTVTTAAATTITMATGNSTAPTVSASITGWTLNLALTRGTDSTGVSGPDLVSGSFTITTSEGSLIGTVTGEATLNAGVWTIRGMTEITGGTAPFTSGVFPGARGGFRATLATHTAGDPADDAITWRMDAFRHG